MAVRTEDEVLADGTVIEWSLRNDHGDVPVRYGCCGVTRAKRPNAFDHMRKRGGARCQSCAQGSRPVSTLRNGGRISGGKAGYQRIHLRAIPKSDHWLVKNETLWQGKYVLEHRYMLAKKIGRPLKANETVHHKDGNPRNNKPANLELRVGNHGKGRSARKMRCPCCDAIITI